MLSVFLKTIVVGLFLYCGYLVFESKFTEQLTYTVIETSESAIELRQYEAFIVAEIDTQAANSREAANKGFRPLAEYIFGSNKPNEKIAMTAPVSTQSTGGEMISMTAPVTTQAKGGEKISMTAPVTTTQNSDNDTYTVQFTMPSKWTMDTLPEPENQNLRLTQKSAQLRFAKTYYGDPSAQEIKEAEQEVLSHAADAGMKVVAEPIWAGYSSPVVPKPLRKWELMLTVER